MGTPVSIKAKVDPHTDPIEDDPFDESTSETTLTRRGIVPKRYMELLEADKYEKEPSSSSSSSSSQK